MARPESSLDQAKAESPAECVICMEVLEDDERLYRQPNCGHVLHEACWFKWVLNFEGSELKCQQCFTPAAQRSHKELWDEVARALNGAGHEWRAQCEALSSLYATQLREVSEELLIDEARHFLFVEGLARQRSPQQLLWLFNFYSVGGSSQMLTLNRRLQSLARRAPPFAVEQRAKELAALVWETKPDLVAQLPPIARLLALDRGSEKEAHYILAGVYSEAPFKNLESSSFHYKAALALGHQDALGKLLPILTESLLRLFRARSFLQCRHHLRGLCVKGAATDAGLVAAFLWEMVEQAKAAPVSFDLTRAEQRLRWLHGLPGDRGKLQQLAALVWETNPRHFASKWPFAARRLKLDEGHAHAHLTLADLYSTEAFEDLEKAYSHCCQAVELGSLHPKDAVPVLLKLAEQADEEAAQWLLETALELDETDQEALSRLARLSPSEGVKEIFPPPGSPRGTPTGVH